MVWLIAFLHILPIVEYIYYEIYHIWNWLCLALFYNCELPVCQNVLLLEYWICQSSCSSNLHDYILKFNIKLFKCFIWTPQLHIWLAHNASPVCLCYTQHSLFFKLAFYICFVVTKQFEYSSINVSKLSAILPFRLNSFGIWNSIQL